MRYFTIIPLIAAFVSSTAALATSHVGRSECQTELPCDWTNGGGDGASLTATVTLNVGRDLTNAERLAQGLPLKAPTRRWHAANRRHDATPSTLPTPPSQQRRGVIQVKRADNQNLLGYISKNTFSKAQYRYQTLDDALVVSFALPAGAHSANNLNFKPENSDITGFDFLGAVQGRDNTSNDFAVGSYQYGYIASTNETPGESGPQAVGNSYSQVTGTTRASESAVWSYDDNDDSISLTWINSDGSAAPTKMFTQSTALYIGGDSGSFASRYPSPVIDVTFTFVSL